MPNMPEETNTKRSRLARNLSEQPKPTNRIVKILTVCSVVVMLSVVSLTVARVIFNFDGISQDTRVKTLQKNAAIALQFGLTGHSDDKRTKQVVHLTNTAWQKEIATSVGKAWKSSAKVANSVTFDGHKYQKKQVISDLSQRYVTTLQRDRNYKITKIRYDRYHNAKVQYQVTPIDLPAGQKKVQSYVEKQLQKKSSEASKLSAEQLRLVEYAMIAENWQSVLKDDMPTAATRNMTITMLYTHENFEPVYQVSKQTLNNILNSGLSE